MKLRLIAPGTILLLCLTACNSLSKIEEHQYRNLIAQGAVLQTPHSPALAGCLNILPGFGDIYNGEWGAFFLDLLLWWPSVTWAIPQGVVTANNYNKKETIFYYTMGPGKGKFDPNKMAPSESIGKD